jgi:hypothetical protein
MISVPGPAISIEDGEITIDAELLANGLGISAAVLQAGMPKGIVSTVVETGIDEDAGLTRLTFRYRSRTWTVVVDSNGSLVESIEPTPKALPAGTDGFGLSDFIGRGS